MNTPKLKVQFIAPVDNSTLTMIIHYQDPRFLKSPGEEREHDFKASNGLKVVSRDCPEVRLDCLYLRGFLKSLDFEPYTRDFGDVARRDELLSKVRCALKDWAANAPEFQPPKKEKIELDITFPDQPIQIWELKDRLILQVTQVSDQPIVTIRVLEQNEKFVSRRGPLSFHSQGFMIASRHRPQILDSFSCCGEEEDKLWLRGSFKAHDFNIVGCTFKSKVEADAYISKLKTALVDWANNAPEFQESVVDGLNAQIKDSKQPAIPADFPGLESF